MFCAKSKRSHSFFLKIDEKKLAEKKDDLIKQRKRKSLLYDVS